MEKERILLLAQLLSSMRAAAGKLDEAIKHQDPEHVALAKSEILKLQAKIDQML